MSNSPDLKKEEQSDVRLTGTITELSETKGKLICENSFFGPIFIPASADARQRKLTDAYQIGDRVSFYVAPSNSPDKPCKFVAINLEKSVEEESSIDFMQNVSAKVSYVEASFGFLQVSQQSTKAFFHVDDVTEPCADLSTRYPFQCRVMCELELQAPHNGCIYRARNVRRLRPTLPFPSLRISVDDSNCSIQREHLTIPDLKRDENNLSNENDGVSSNEDEDFFPEANTEAENVDEPVEPCTATCSVACQTEKMLELQAVQSILAKGKVFHVLCSECPETLQTLLQCQLRF